MGSENYGFGRRGEDPCHLAFRQTLDLLKVIDESLANLCLDCQLATSPDAVLLRALNEMARAEPDAEPRAPSHVLFAHGAPEELTGTLYALGPGGYASTGAPVWFALAQAPALAMGSRALSISNAEEESASLEEYQALFLPEVRKRIGGPIRNFISYRIVGDKPGAIIGYNYPRSASRYDGQVLSALAVTLGSFWTLSSRIADVEGGFLYLVGALARASEVNDQTTGDHLIRVSLCTEALARGAGLSPDDAWTIAYSSQLHDVGKIQIPREILRKEGPLDPEESRIMREHTLAGERIIGTSPRLLVAHRIAGGHHENWDGSGYPRGLAGEEIPFEARVVRIVDVYDALRSRRPYKAPYTHERACDVLFEGDERIDPRRHFDPRLLTAFREIQGEFERIHRDVESVAGADPLLPR